MKNINQLSGQDKNFKKKENSKKIKNSNKLTRKERKQIRAARKARAKARSSTKLSVRIIGLTLALIMLAAFVVPGVVMVYRTLFVTRSSMPQEAEIKKLLEELSKIKSEAPPVEGDENNASEEESNEADGGSPQDEHTSNEEGGSGNQEVLNSQADWI